MGGWGTKVTGPGNTLEKDWKGALEGTAVEGRVENQMLGRGILSLAKRGGALEFKKNCLGEFRNRPMPDWESPVPVFRIPAPCQELW